MKLYGNWIPYGLVVLGVAALTPSCAFHHKKYENPITKDTQQPDKVLFDKAVGDIEHGRYEVARLTLNTLMNTYDQSEFLAKSKLAIADSWYREGGSHGLAQAEAEYKDFILFYPAMEEAAEAQEKVCTIHFKQMDKADRDPTHALRAEEECRTLMTQFPNSKFAPQGQQILRQIQEVLADSEFRVGSFYHHKGVYYSAANRLDGLTRHYPLFSKADEALWQQGDSFGHLGPRFRNQSAEAYTQLVRDYPLSPRAEEAKQKLKEMEKPIPEPDPVRLQQQKYELENRETPGMMSHFWGIFRKGPDVSMAAKSGQPAMDSLRPSTPVTVPVSMPGTAGADVTATTVSGPSALDTQPDARQNQPKPEGAADPSKPGDQAKPTDAPASGDQAKPAAASASGDQAKAGDSSNTQQQPAKPAKKTKKTKKTKNTENDDKKTNE
jgi:outer membrane protein assembly factor BamD